MTDKDLYLKIGKPNNACTNCARPITHAGKHPSVLRAAGEPPARAPEKQAAPQNDEQDSLPLPTPPDGPRREDYCADCWQQLTEKDYLGFWMARREPPKVRKIESCKERNAGVLAWFDLLRTQEPDEDNLQAQFFLAHLLMKYGVLKWNRTETDDSGRETIYFRQTGTDDDVAVVSVELSDEKSVDIKRELDEFLLRFANTPTADAPPAEATAKPADQ